MKSTALVPAFLAMVASGLTVAQDGRLMEGRWGHRMLGGYGGVWIVVLLVAIVGLLAWLVIQKRK